jgi:hypothetical protein
MSDLNQCFTSLYPVGNDWIGARPGAAPVHFQSMDTYRQYNARTGCPDVSGVRSTEAYIRKEQRTPYAGFKELKPVNPQEQALYSAMSPLWVGRSSDSAKVYH